MQYGSIFAQNPTWTYTELEQRVWQIAQQFEQQQIRSVALWFEDGAKLACTLLACWHAKVRSVFLPNLTEESIRWANSLSDLFLTDNVLSHSSIQSKVICFDEFGVKQPLNAAQRSLFDFYADTEFLLKTSGSTGTPKIITKTASQLWQSAAACINAFGFSSHPQHTAVCTVSIQHLYGLICQIAMPLQLGWQIDRKQHFYPENIAQACILTEQAVLISSPTMLSNIDWQRLTFPNLKGIVSAGGSLPPHTNQTVFNALGFNVIDFYGTTEVGSIAMRLDNHLWKPMQGVRLGVDERSTLWIEADWFEGREQTEDVVTLFDDQCFEMHGRADRILKLGDKRVSLLSIEQTLSTHAFVNDCYIGKHPKHERLVAWIALSGSGFLAYQRDRKTLIASLRTHLSHSQERIAQPRFWRFTNRLPRNSQSKISKIDFEKICLSETLDHFYD